MYGLFYFCLHKIHEYEVLPVKQGLDDIDLSLFWYVGSISNVEMLLS